MIKFVSPSSRTQGSIQPTRLLEEDVAAAEIDKILSTMRSVSDGEMIKLWDSLNPQLQDRIAPMLVDDEIDVLQTAYQYDPGHASGGNPDEEDEGTVGEELVPEDEPLAAGTATRQIGPGDAEIIEYPPNHKPVEVLDCVYFADTKYALCGDSSPDPRVTNTDDYESREEAINAVLHEYGYGEVPGIWHALAGRNLGTYSRAYYWAWKYRWHAEVNGRGTNARIYSNGPEPDPVFSFLLLGGSHAVSEWHRLV